MITRIVLPMIATAGVLWLSLLMRANPLTYGVSVLREVLYGPAATVGSSLPGIAVSLAITVGLGLVCVAACLLATRGGRVD